jgi:hypothetical protein
MQRKDHRTVRLRLALLLTAAMTVLGLGLALPVASLASAWSLSAIPTAGMSVTSSGSWGGHPGQVGSSARAGG